MRRLGPLGRVGVCLAALPLWVACGEKHEPVKLIARPPAAAEVPAPVAVVPVLPPASASASSMPPSAPAVAASAAPATTAAAARQPPPPALAVPQRIVRPGEPTGNDAFRAAIEARSAARAAAGESPSR